MAVLEQRKKRKSHLAAPAVWPAMDCKYALFRESINIQYFAVARLSREFSFELFKILPVGG